MIDYENPWLYSDRPFSSEEIGDSYGFVYLITNRSTGKKYVGKKLFYSKKTKVLKGKKKRSVVESDWKKYYGSSEELQTDIAAVGKDQFERVILRLCKSKGECNYWEAHEQFERRVLLSDQYYNSWIQVKVHRSHVNKKVKVDGTKHEDTGSDVREGADAAE